MTLQDVPGGAGESRMEEEFIGRICVTPLTRIEGIPLKTKHFAGRTSTDTLW